MALNNDDIKQLIAILQRGLSDQDDQETEPQVEKVKKSNKNKNNIKTKKTKISQDDSSNKFIELGFDKLHREDIAIDKVLRKGPPTPRRRKLSQTKVRCRVCGREETINASLLYESPDRYKCNKCCSSPG